MLPRSGSPGTQYLELFTLDMQTGQETQLTAGARARLPAPDPDGCVLYVRDTAAEGVRLMRWCQGETRVRWQAPAGWHVVGLAVSDGGQVALAVWREGHVNLALLERDALRWLTDGAHADTDPRFDGEGALLFTSDRDGGLESYRLGLDSGRLEQLTHTVGGASEPLVVRDASAGITSASDTLIVRALGSAGYDLAWLPLRAVETRVQTQPVSPPSPPSISQNAPPAPIAYPVRPYSPWSTLEPYGWLPAVADASLSPLGVSLGATVFGQDASNEHAYTLSAGYAPAQGGPLAGGHASLSYQYRANTVLTALVPPHPLSFGVRFGLWPQAAGGQTAIAAGAQVQVGVTWPLDLWTLSGVAETGLLYLGGTWQPDARAALTLSRQRRDDWAYVTRGTRFNATARVAATLSGPQSAWWASAEHHFPATLGPLSGTVELGARAGYRPPPPVPHASAGWAAFGTVGYRVSVPTPLRYGDGLYALERLTLEPRLRLWWAGEPGGGPGVGADVSAFADALLNYAAPVSAGVTIGYANGFWYGVGFRLPL